MISLLECQLNNRFISNGPPKTMMLAMQLDKGIRWPPTCLTTDQVAVAEAHMRAARAEGAELAVPSVAAALVVAAAEVEADDLTCDLFECDAVDQSALVVADVETSNEEYKWAHMLKEDYDVGNVQRFGGTPTRQTLLQRVFDPMFFWANPRMQAKYPDGLRVFKGSYAGLPQEATSESTFSEAGRAFSDSRTDVGKKQLCSAIVCNSGEKRHATDPAHVQATYKKLKAIAVAERAAAAGGALGGAAAGGGGR